MNYFDEIARVWHKISHYDSAKIERLLSLLQLRQDDLVLDVGTGTGAMIPYIRKQVGSLVPIAAVDSSAKMLQEARRCHPCDDIHFIRADVEQDSLPGRYDALLLYQVFPHFHNPVETIARLVINNLRCGGRLLIAHPQNRLRVNELHERLSGQVYSRSLLPVEEQVAQFCEMGLSVSSFDETDEYYYILLQRVGKRVSAPVVGAFG